jgi:hypothetical protein
MEKEEILSGDDGVLALTKIARGEKSELLVRVVDIDQLGETGSLTFIRLTNGSYHYVTETLGDIENQILALLD